MDDYRAAEIKANLTTFARDASATPRDAISLKIRHTLNPEGDPSSRFLYSEDYDELAVDLNLPARTFGVYQGSGTRSLGSHAVIVEHETGPELVILACGLANTIDPFVTIAGAFGIVIGMGRWVWTKLKADRHRAPPHGNFVNAQCVRFERRRIAPDGTVDITVMAITNIDEEFDADAIGAQLRTKLHLD